MGRLFTLLSLMPSFVSIKGWKLTNIVFLNKLSNNYIIQSMLLSSLLRVQRHISMLNYWPRHKERIWVVLVICQCPSYQRWSFRPRNYVFVFFPGGIITMRSARASTVLSTSLPLTDTLVVGLPELHSWKPPLCSSPLIPQGKRCYQAVWWRLDSGGRCVLEDKKASYV